ncbi:hypothetical protein DCAR_0832499 [Daucus carota subsp. sativus]|uniref:Uncharacterized protein n=1 Tax=Daucus carota subsp. sativus TaxID=79200 RepID=A0A175YRN3_DAUCS|nr:hypothetical protein DCAR_0832499 [Daucus carota subsp. sativus]
MGTSEARNLMNQGRPKDISKLTGVIYVAAQFKLEALLVQESQFKNGA